MMKKESDTKIMRSADLFVDPNDTLAMDTLVKWTGQMSCGATFKSVFENESTPSKED